MKRSHGRPEVKDLPLPKDLVTLSFSKDGLFSVPRHKKWKRQCLELGFLVAWIFVQGMTGSGFPWFLLMCLFFIGSLFGFKQLCKFDRFKL